MKQTIRITLFYLLFGSLWIWVGDYLVFQWIGTDSTYLYELQLIKGMAFVLLSTLLIYLLVRAFYRDLIRQRGESDTFKEEVLETLARRNQFIEATLDHLPIGIAVNRIDEGKATYINPAFSQIYGWPVDELLGVETFFEKVYPDPEYRAWIKAQVLTGTQSGDPRQMNWQGIRITTQAGETRIISAKNIPVYEQNLMISTVIDETEKTRTQKLFEEIFERIPVMVTIYDAQVGRVRVNKTFETITGYTQGRIDEIDLMAACYPDPEVRAAAAGWMHQSNREWKEFELTTREGEKRRQEWTNLRLDSDTFIGIGIDVTDHRRQEAALSLAHQRLRIAQQTAKLGYWEWDLETQRLIWSEEVYEIWEESPENFEPALDKFFATIHPDDLESLRRAREPALLGKGDFNIQHRVCLPGGRIKWVHQKARLICDDTGKALRFSGSTQDITEQKEAEIKIQEKEAFLRILAENAFDGILACDAGGRLIYFNKTLRSWLDPGVERRPWPLEGSLYTPDESRLVELEGLPLRRAFKGEELRNVEFVIRSIGQAPRNIEVNGGPLFDEKNRQIGAVAVIRDITDRKMQEFHITRAILQATEQEREHIARELHDGLTQNLSVASINLKNIVYDFPQINQAAKYLKARQYLEMAIEQSRTVAHQLIPKAISDFGLIPAIEQLLEGLQGTYSAQLHFHYNMQAELSPALTLNLYRIVQEALHNIHKHARATEAHIDLKIESSFLNLSIQDNGVGFVHNGRENMTGIGLRTMQNRAKQLQGTLHIQSEPGKGTRLHLIVPFSSNLPPS